MINNAPYKHYCNEIYDCLRFFNLNHSLNIDLTVTNTIYINGMNICGTVIHVSGIYDAYEILKSLNK